MAAVAFALYHKGWLLVVVGASAALFLHWFAFWVFDKIDQKRLDKEIRLLLTSSPHTNAAD
jgi:hypothetical protein